MASRSDFQFWKIRGAAVLGVLAIFLGPPVSFALAPSATFQQVVAESDWIFVGRIEKIDGKPALHDANGPLTKLTISVGEVICGRPEAMGLKQGVLEILYNLEFLERPNFQRGKSFLFFWKNDENGPRLAPEYYGALPVVAGEVDVSIFAGVKKTAGTRDLKDKISCPKH